MNIIDCVAVYGTLKRDHGNYGSMLRARGEFIATDYIQVDRVGDCGFPMVKLSKDSKKWLKVELFNVPIEGIEGPLDSLEGYHPGSTWNLYNRTKVKTKGGRNVWVYEIERELEVDALEEMYTHKEDDDLFYNWKDDLY